MATGWGPEGEAPGLGKFLFHTAISMDFLGMAGVNGTISEG